MATTLRQLITPTLNAVRTYWPAILIIQGLALAVVISYYTMDGAADFFAIIATWKQNGGLLFSSVTTIISGGVIPETLKYFFRPSGRKAPQMAELIHQTIMWAIVGMLVDLFYRLQGVLFGHGYDWWTLLRKILFDQLVFTPLISMAFIVVWFRLYECHYKLGPWLEWLSPGNLANRILPLWFSCLAFWPVMLLIVYSLPRDLQFPLFLFGNSAYSILMIFIARQQCDEN